MPVLDWITGEAEDSRGGVADLTLTILLRAVSCDLEQAALVVSQVR